MPTFQKSALLPLKGVRILSLALNLPGPAALMRCRTMGAVCVKLEPLSGDPMDVYNPLAYAEMHQGIKLLQADLKSAQGQKLLHRELQHSQVLITSFRPSALRKLGLGWKNLHSTYPALSQVAIVGALGQRAEEPGHDLTYLAENDLLTGLEMPATLYADMAGSLMASEAILQAVMHQRVMRKGVYAEVALSAAAGYLALPRAWGLTTSGAAVGGGHAGYRIYPCSDGRVALAALEPHFAARLCAAAGLQVTQAAGMYGPKAHQHIADFLRAQTCQQLDALASSDDIPLYTPSN